MISDYALDKIEEENLMLDFLYQEQEYLCK